MYHFFSFGAVAVFRIAASKDIMGNNKCKNILMNFELKRGILNYFSRKVINLLNLNVAIQI